MPPTVEPVVRQTLLSLSEVFLYTIPPLQSKDGKESGHFADNWNLAKPLQRCSLQVQQKGHQVLLIFMSQKESEQVLFAHCTIDLSDAKKTLADFFEPVLDSTRYFVIHITDETSDRKAHVGIGFRERDDANHLKEILEDYAQAVQN